MDQAIRNKLRNVVTQCRKLLEDAVAQVLQGQFGIYPTGKKDEVHVEDESRMTNLVADEDRACRRDLLDHFEHIQALGYKPKDALAQLVREIAFTHLNRLCAYKMMEARRVVVNGRPFREAVSRGLKSQGFLFYLADHSEDETRYNSGHQDVAYQHFLDWLGGTLSEEIGVLFSPTDPANRLYPPQRVLDDVLDLINTGDIKPEEKELQEAWPTIWSTDETIGWVYQYFTPKELRDQARKESAAPRNSYELAFRNQFFTPRYVVEFLTDNTLGRIWYEMRKGDTKVKEKCRYMVRRPSETFLAEGQSPYEPTRNQEELSQEDLLKQPVHIPHRPKKDPRDLRILDPACGSGHFLLYCFDLLLTIYEEAYADPDLGPKFKEDYPTLEALRRDVPRLILAHNLHGIDIDLRASQIAALALWLRCQRAYREMNLKQERPKITKSNIVCAEPMPGEKEMLDEFLKTLKQDRLETLIRRVMQVPEGSRVRATESMVESLTELVRLVWDRMQLAGEAGSLLKIEEELQEAVRKGQEEWEEEQPLFRFTEFSLTEKPKESYVRFVPGDGLSFWQRAEALVLEALRDYARHAANGGRLQRQLFADDAERGFAFIDICQKRFDAALMNPPFGEGSKLSKGYIDHSYPKSKNDSYATFVERALSWLKQLGMLGAISSRTGFFLTSFQKWREDALLNTASIFTFADLGQGVLDTAVVETAAYCFSIGTDGVAQEAPFFRLLKDEDKETLLRKSIQNLSERATASSTVFHSSQSAFSSIPGSPFAYWVGDGIRHLFTDLSPFDDESNGRATRCGLGTLDDFRFIRLKWEVRNGDVGHLWKPYYHGGVYSPFYDEFPLVVRWGDDGKEIKRFVEEKVGSASRKVQGEDRYFSSGFVFPRRTRGFSPKAMPKGGIYSTAGQAGFVPEKDIPWTIALLSSKVCSYLISLSQGRTGDAAQFEVGLVKRLPWPEPNAVDQKTLGQLEEAAFAIKRRKATSDECGNYFAVPALLPCDGETLHARYEQWLASIASCDQEIRLLQDEIEEISFRLYKIGPKDRQLIDLDSTPASSVDGSDDGEAGGEDIASDCSERTLVGAFVSYLVGCVVGRWDIRSATRQRQSNITINQFAPIPACSPGMFRADLDGIEEYPIQVDVDGILPADPDHTDDIVRRVREVLELIWKDRVEAIEKESCEILGVNLLRDYFGKSGKGGFWDDHIKRYSKSRRKAPIYWLLQSSRKNYALWLYYQRLNKDILFKALVNYVEPKIRLEENRLESLRGQKVPGDKATKKLDKEIEKQEGFLSELRDFGDKLRRAANLHLEPDLNDGVVLNIAPLRELVPWREAKDYWEELLEGKYEWSSIGKQLREKGLVKC